MTQVKKVLGYKIGDLKNDKGEKVHFVHLNVCYPKEGVTGLAVDIFKCVSDDVLNGINPGDYVMVYFDENKKVQLLMPEEPTIEDLLSFGEILSPDDLPPSSEESATELDERLEA